MGPYIYVIMKTIGPPIDHQDTFVATQALGYMMYGMYIDSLYCR